MIIGNELECFMAELEFEKQLRKMERDGLITRKQFLQIMAAASAFIALGTDKAYAAKSNASGRIVIVGGGAAGISMASRLKRALKNPDITIIDPSEKHFYQPGFTLIGGGVYGTSPRPATWITPTIKAQTILTVHAHF